MGHEDRGAWDWEGVPKPMKTLSQRLLAATLLDAPAVMREASAMIERLELRASELERLLRIAQTNARDNWAWHANLHAQVDRALERTTCKS
jgi:hypothetical protein